MNTTKDDRLCVPKYSGGRDCVILESGDSNIRCVQVTDSVECALKLQSGEVDVGVFTAEEALLASKFIDNSTKVILQIVPQASSETTTTPKYKFESVAVVRSNHTGGLSGLRGKNLCHPGFHRTQYWSDRVLKEFELAVVETQCEAKEGRSAVENEVYSLSQFFNSTCRPGPWVLNDWLDDKLKRDNSKLCALCDVPSTCEYRAGISSNHLGALECLHRGLGDVAYVDREIIKTYFGMAGNEGFSFLCRNGTLEPLTTEQPCTWVQQRWDAVIARNHATRPDGSLKRCAFSHAVAGRQSPLVAKHPPPPKSGGEFWAEGANSRNLRAHRPEGRWAGGPVRACLFHPVLFCSCSIQLTPVTSSSIGFLSVSADFYLDVAAALKASLLLALPSISANRRLDWTDNLANVMLKESSYVVQEVVTTNLKYFIQEGRVIPEPANVTDCRSYIRWCTISPLEVQKCEWVRQAGITHGILPELTCVEGSSKFDCFRKIEAGQADIVGINTNLGYLAKFSYNLTSAGYQESNSYGNNIIVPIIRADSIIGDLKGLVKAKACFPEFGGLAWVAFIESLRSASLVDRDVCPYGASANSLFASVCAPGSKDSDYDRQGLNNGTDLCALCSEANLKLPTPFASVNGTTDTCSANASTNPFYGDLGALRCLSTGVADVAIIEATNISAIIAELGFQAEYYNILCRNGTKISIRAEIPDGCTLAAVLGGEVIARRNRTNSHTRDIANVITELDDWFGYAYHNYENIFHIFEEFNGTQGVLLQNNTLALLNVFNKQSSYISSYDDIKRNAYECSRTNNGAMLQSTLALLFTLVAVKYLSGCLVAPFYGKLLHEKTISEEQPGKPAPKKASSTNFSNSQDINYCGSLPTIHGRLEDTANKRSFGQTDKRAIERASDWVAKLASA
uniref:Transferrin-like domain-containing protein n=1 Tax=Timema bartmani TaxID=61472 RepID=A0A7R9EQW1_9NEOP|nr:unnamed protein product [Timema bartmani]